MFAVADQSPLNFVGNLRRFSVVIVGLFSVVMLMTVLLIVIRVGLLLSQPAIEPAILSKLQIIEFLPTSSPCLEI